MRYCGKYLGCIVGSMSCFTKLVVLCVIDPSCCFVSRTLFLFKILFKKRRVCTFGPPVCFARSGKVKFDTDGEYFDRAAVNVYSKDDMVHPPWLLCVCVRAH